jgi:NADH-quinone oxidoreductase subunit N
VSFFLLSPEIALAILALVLVGADLVTSDKEKSWLAYLAVIGLAVPAALVAAVSGNPGTSFAGTLSVDPLAAVFQGIVLLSAALVILASVDYVKRHTRFQGEFYALVLFATLGAMFLASGSELITLYVALELTSISQYIMAGFLKGDQESSEAGIKYLLLGALSSAVLLYGIALLYGATGTTTLSGIRSVLAAAPTSPLALLAMVLLICGFGFKIAIVPFQMWVPDVYQGAPTPVTAFLSVASKAAGFAVVLRIFGVGLQPLDGVWPSVFAGLAVITMTVGNLAALRQTDVKRLMGYSSIGQAGYALTGLSAASHATATGLVFFLIAYAVTNLGTFIAIIYLSDRIGSDQLADYAGLSRRAPLASLALTVSLLSLVGLPPMVGFWSKVYLFLSVFEAGQVGLVIVGLLNSAIAAFYYLKVVHAIYLKPPASEWPLRPDPSLGLALVIAVAGVFVTGLIPGPFIQAASAAAGAVFP